MRPDEVLKNEVREWLDRARADLMACDALIRASLPGEALFYAQQCAEKAMKALLTWNQMPFRKTHDLDELKELKAACIPFIGEAAEHLLADRATVALCPGSAGFGHAAVREPEALPNRVIHGS